MAFWLYILKCADNTLYIGHTDNLDTRMQQYDRGSVNAYTTARRPLTLLYAEEFASRYEALTFERQLKGWSRAKKIAYIDGDWKLIQNLSKGKHKHERNNSHIATTTVRPERKPVGLGMA